MYVLDVVESTCVRFCFDEAIYRRDQCDVFMPRLLREEARPLCGSNMRLIAGERHAAERCTTKEKSSEETSVTNAVCSAMLMALVHMCSLGGFNRLCVERDRRDGSVRGCSRRRYRPEAEICDKIRRGGVAGSEIIVNHGGTFSHSTERGLCFSNRQSTLYCRASNCRIQPVSLL